MEITREELNPCTIKLTIKCSPEEVREGFDRAFKQLTKKIKLPGFRPGHAPKAMVENLVPKNDLYDAAAEAIVNKTFRAAIEQEQLQLDPGSRPAVELTTLDQDQSVAEYTAKVPLPPVVQMGEYKGLPVERTPVTVSEEEVDRLLEELRNQRSTRKPVTDRGVEEGDVAVVNIKPEGETTEGRNFMTIAGQTFPELDAALLGMRVEEMKNLELPFPDNFQEKDWAGKTIRAQVTLNSLSAVTTPEIDEEFAKSLKTENVEELRTRLREGIERAKEQGSREMMHEQLLERLHERSTIHVSDNMWEGLAARRLQETAEEQRKKNRTLEQYAAENGMTVESLAEAWRQAAKKHVERALMIREIFTTESMKLTNIELNQELVAMAQEYETDPEQMFKMLKENNALDELHFRAISRKVSDFLLTHADVKEVAAVEA